MSFPVFKIHTSLAGGKISSFSLRVVRVESRIPSRPCTLSVRPLKLVQLQFSRNFKNKFLFPPGMMAVCITRKNMSLGYSATNLMLIFQRLAATLVCSRCVLQPFKGASNIKKFGTVFKA
jgi:hypothetical protein